MSRSDILLDMLRTEMDVDIGVNARARLSRVLSTFKELDGLCNNDELPVDWKPYEDSEEDEEQVRRREREEDRARQLTERRNLARQMQDQQLQVALLNGLLPLRNSDVDDMVNRLRDTAHAVRKYRATS